MSLLEQDSAHHADHASILPDTNDPTAGQVAISRELASEQADDRGPGAARPWRLALTTFLLSLVNAGVMDAAAEPVVLGVALAYGGVAQILAGMWEFRKGNVFGATASRPTAPLGVVLGLCRLLREGGTGREPWAGSRLVPDGVGDLYDPHADSRTTHDPCARRPVRNSERGAVPAQLRSLGVQSRSDEGGGNSGPRRRSRGVVLCLAGVMASTFGRPILPNRPLFRASARRQIKGDEDRHAC